ncbi:uncharacterized protein NEMAJ01_1606 [Nematocida major]|uniref:uncharacterized protein n=1 Tax=Nematocida major TaxID=1912982 RepID=UPI00200829C9|nr:uncharacterized protein NEMAJ01_1606 [Nematocida major]KAH9386710.1 hypothetical protein NEMAJ01_1606 [Nematocida major]
MNLYFGLACVLFSAVHVAKCIKPSHGGAVACVEAVVGRSGGEDVCVNPKWAGHPACIPWLCWLGYVRNMRGYSSGMATHFSTDTGSSHGYATYAHREGLHLPGDIEGAAAFGKNGGYSLLFHRTLLQMFGLRRDGGLAYDCLTVETGRPCSFTLFLREGCRTQKEAHYVLAALVLLSEGVDVPIKVAGNRVIVKKSQESADVLVDASMEAFYGSEGQPSETWQVVSFFKRYRGTHMLPSTYEEFKTGDFLESPQLLILTYIGEYATSFEELTAVMRCIFNLLEGMGLAESLEGPDSVASRLFVPAWRLPEAQAYLDAFLGAQAEIANLRRLSEFMRFQREIKAKGHASASKSFSECCYLCSNLSMCEKAHFECNGKCSSFLGVCALLLCLAYDPEKRGYSLDGLLRGAEDTKEAAKTRAFLQNLGNHLEECSSFGPFDPYKCNYTGLWRIAVTQLKDILVYIKPGFLKFMWALAQMTGQPQAVVKSLRPCKMAMCGLKKTSLDRKKIKNICALLRSLAVNKQVQVGIQENSSRKGYLLVISHPHEEKRRRQTLMLSFRRKVSLEKLELPTVFHLACTKKNMKNAAAQYKKSTAFSGFVFAECMARAALECQEEDFFGETIRGLRKEVRRAVEFSPDRPNCVLLALPATHQAFKKELFSALLLYAHASHVALSPHHPIARLTANLVGRSKGAPNGMEPVPSFGDMLKTMHPIAQMFAGRAEHSLELYSLSDYVRMHPPEKRKAAIGEAYMQYFQMYAENKGKPLFECERLHKCLKIRPWSEFLFGDSPLESLQEISRLVLAEHTGKDLERAQALVRRLQLAWLIILLDMGLEKHREDILQVYQIVDLCCSEAELKEIRCFLSGEDINSVVERLHSIKAALMGAGGIKKLSMLWKTLRAAR